MDGGVIQNKGYFYLGCQGPDILFSNWRAIKSSLRLGLAMHSRRTRELMSHALDYLKRYNKSNKDELISYFAGLMTHYAVDKCSHPYIHSRAGSNIGKHQAVEYILDNLTSVAEWDVESRHFDMASDALADTLDDGISKWYVSAADEVYGKRIKSKAVRRAPVSFARSKQRMFADPRRAKRFFIWLFSGLKVKKMLCRHQYKESIFSRDEFAEMQELVQSGVNEACHLIGFMLDYIRGAKWEIPETLFERNFLGDMTPLADA
jgi:hypothetical protein